MAGWRGTFVNPTFELVHYPAMSVMGSYGNCRRRARPAQACRYRPSWIARFPPEETATGLPSREILEISEFFRSLLTSNALAGRTRRCPADGYDIVDHPRFAMQ